MKWIDATLVAFDLETTGKYPLEAEICEVAAVKYQSGQIVGEFQSLVKPSRPMSAEVIKIHNITNEMVESAPDACSVLARFLDFLGEAVGVAHHAPFDMGFLAAQIEVCGLPLPRGEVFCSSLISRRAIPAAPNHRLQTLISYLGIPQGQAHRALDDAKACLSVLLASLQRIGTHASIDEILRYQEKPLKWQDFSIVRLKEKQNCLILIEAIQKKKIVSIVYEGGSRPGRSRDVEPLGLVRTPDGDYVIAREVGLSQTKRYQLAQISFVKCNP